MSEIQGIGSTQGPGEIGRKAGKTGQKDGVQGAKETGDTVHLSPKAAEALRFTDALRQVPPLRTERIDQIKKAIQAGTYLTDDKIDKAVRALLNDL